MKNNKTLVYLTIILSILISIILEDKIFNINNQTQLNDKHLIAEDYVEVDYLRYDNCYIGKVKFKNLDNTLTQDFLIKQDEIIKNAGSSATNQVWYQINSGILTVYNQINCIGNECINEVLTVNIDLEKNKILSNEEVLKLAGYNFHDIALKEYNETLSELDNGVKFYDDDNNEISKEYFEKNKNLYVNRIGDSLDEIIQVYIQYEEVKYDIKPYDIVLSYKDILKDSSLEIVTKIVGIIK